MGSPAGCCAHGCVRLGCERAIGWATSHPDCMDRLREHYSHFVGGKECCLDLSRCMTTESADYYMLVNEWVWSKSQRLEVDLGSVLESELGQKWRYGTLKACLC